MWIQYHGQQSKVAPAFKRQTSLNHYPGVVIPYSASHVCTLVLYITAREGLKIKSSHSGSVFRPPELGNVWLSLFEMLTPRAIIIILYIGLIQTRLACLHITLVVTLDYNNK